jgi:predicted metal-dependent phosphoesterase TrpH
VIDLHLHTTASDGRCTPSELVRRAAAAGVTIMAATDHDTTAATPTIAALASSAGIHAVPGIEITAVEHGADVHILGYFLDVAQAGLQRFLTSQREHRLERVRQIAARLDELGMPVDLQAILSQSGEDGARSIGRPQIARAMIAAGHVASLPDAFAKWLGRECPAFVPRVGPSPETVIETIHAARGIASLAHPGRTCIDARIPALRAAGLDALEVFHSDHGPDDRSRYLALARGLGVLVTGGSDFHGEPARGIEPGHAALPAEEWAALQALARPHV